MAYNIIERCERDQQAIDTHTHTHTHTHTNNNNGLFDPSSVPLRRVRRERERGRSCDPVADWLAVGAVIHPSSDCVCLRSITETGAYDAENQ